MKPIPIELEHEGDNLGELTIDMAVGENEHGHIMNVLSTLYPHPKEAVVREYPSNARDAHDEAGQTRPVEVLTPTILDPYLVIKDWGTGMSLEDVQNVYSKYGVSTRRHTDTATGTLGLGSKSAFTYCDDWQMISRKDGMKVICQMHRTPPMGLPKIDILFHGPTDEENGTEVRIPELVEGDFDEDIKKFFKYWREGEVLIDGKPPEQIQGRWLGDNILIREPERDRWGDPRQVQDDVIVMGGVPYPVPSEKALFIQPALPTQRAKYRPQGRRLSLVCWVKMGSVGFAPSRESLYYDTHTEKTLETLRTEIQERIRFLMEQEIHQAPSAWDALAATKRWIDSGQIFVDNPTWKGHSIPYEWTFPGWEMTISDQWTSRYVHEKQKTARFSGINGKKWSFDELMTFQREQAVHAVIVTGVPKDYDQFGDLHRRHKVKLRAWGVATGAKVAILTTDHEIDPVWLENLRTIPYSEAIKMRPLQKRGVYQKGDYTLTTFAERLVRVSDILPGYDVVYVESLEEARTYNRVLRTMRETNPDKSYIGLVIPPFRQDKFLKKRPDARTLFDAWNTDVLDPMKAQINKYPIQHFNLGQDDRRLLRAIAHRQINHPEVKSMIELALTPENARVRRLLKLYNDYVNMIPMKRTTHRAIQFDRHEKLITRFPLIRNSWYHREDEKLHVHIVAYINAVWELEKDTDQAKLLELELAAGRALAQAARDRRLALEVADRLLAEIGSIPQKPADEPEKEAAA